MSRYSIAGKHKYKDGYWGPITFTQIDTPLIDTDYNIYPPSFADIDTLVETTPVDGYDIYPPSFADISLFIETTPVDGYDIYPVTYTTLDTFTL